MSKVFHYYAPFAESSAAVSAQNLQGFLAQAATAQVKSFDDVPVRLKVASDTRGFLPVQIRFEDYGVEVVQESVDTIAEILGLSEVGGVRGARGVLIDSELTEEGDEVIVTAWIGRNIWFNEHRVTAGYPENENQRARVLSDLSDRLINEFHEIFVEIDEVDEEEEQGVSREAAIEKISELRDKLNTAIADLRQCADPEEILLDLVEATQEWADEAEEIVQA